MSPTQEKIRVGDQRFARLSLPSAQAAGIRMIHQEFPDVPTLSVAENVLLGRLPSRLGVVNWRAVRAWAAAVFKDMGIAMDPDKLVGSLSVGERQVVEIAKALSERALALILDEPTGALSQQEVDRLFACLRRLRDQGTAIIYITHRLDEVKEISDRVQVLRDGFVAAEGDTASFDRKRLVEAMLGHAGAQVTRPPAPASERGSTPLLELRDASCEPLFSHVSFCLYPGEILVLYGKLGSGCDEIAETFFGLRKLSSGSLMIGDASGTPRGPASSVKRGIGFVPADRKRQAIFPVRPVAENIAAPSWSRLARFRLLISRRVEAASYRRWREVLSIHSRNDPMQPAATLSGGNQQKVVLARWLERGSPILVMVEPTRGVDVGARADIYHSLRELAAEGVGLLISTNDQEEVVQVADRVIVLARGGVVAELDGEEITTTRLLTEAVE